jgi:hypothetical protein
MDGAEGVAVCGDWFSPLQSSTGEAHTSLYRTASAVEIEITSN